MSYDLNLFRSGNSNEILKEEELAKLNEQFDVTITAGDGDRVEGFDVSYKDDPSKIRDEFFRQDDGSYWTYVSYQASEERLEHLKSVAKKVASLLGLKIKDPQIGEDLVAPENYDVKNSKSIKNFNHVKNIVIPNTPYLIPTKSKYFIRYFITSTNPVTSRKVVLTFQSNGIYASKVNVGEALLQVIKKDMIELTGSDQFKIVQVIDHFDSSFDRQGNKLPRSAVYLEIPYRDLTKQPLAVPFKWVEVEDSIPKENNKVEIAAIQNHNLEQLRLYDQQYRDAKKLLQEKFPDYYVGSLMIYKDKSQQTLTMSVWTNFMATIFPESDYVMFVISEYHEEGKVNVTKSYIIEQRKLFSLQQITEKIISPVNCFRMDFEDDVTIQQRILENSQFLNEKIH